MIALKIVSWLVIWASLMGVAEYTIHRWVMHNPRVPTRLLRYVWRCHAVEHHGNERNDLNIDLPLWHHLLVGSPILLALVVFQQWVGLALLLAVFVHHSWTWTHTHRCIHGLGSRWIACTPLYYARHKHHVGHHRRPGRNYGVVYIFMDRLFGTHHNPGRVF